MQDREFYQEILGLKSPRTVSKVSLDVPGVTLRAIHLCAAIPRHELPCADLLPDQNAAVDADGEHDVR
jgi:hypothetical protein